MNRPTQFEVWERFAPKVCETCGNRKSMGRHHYSGGDIFTALGNVPWRRKRFVVITFYDRHQRRRVVQFVAGEK